MKCKEENCGGEVEVSSDKAVSIRIGCGGCGGSRSCANAYPCNKCGSLHYDDGSSIATRAGANVFLIDGKVVRKTFKLNAAAGKQIVIEPIGT